MLSWPQVQFAASWTSDESSQVLGPLRTMEGQARIGRPHGFGLYHGLDYRWGGQESIPLLQCQQPTVRNEVSEMLLCCFVVVVLFCFRLMDCVYGVRVHASLYTYKSMYVYVLGVFWLFTRTHTRTHARTRTHAHAHTHARTHARTHTHTYINTHAHTH